MAMGMPYGLQAMLKEGHKHFSGLEEAVLKNIDACKGLAQITRTSLGPNGMNKLVINHLEKIFVTSDASTIISELDVFHPAAKLVAKAASAQEAEIGDGTNLVLTLAGELLGNAEGLLRDGLHPTEIADGYSKACEKALEVLASLVLPGSEEVDIRDEKKVAERLKGSLASKQYGHEGLLAPLVARACIHVCPTNPQNFNVDNVRVVKLRGASLSASHVVSGMVLPRDAEGTIKEVQDAKVAVFAQGIDTAGTETKGTVLVKSAEQLEGYAKGEEAVLEAYVKAVADTGTRVVVSGGNVGDMAMHFLEKYGIMVLRIPSKFDLRRFCRATGAVAQVKLGTPLADELGFAHKLRVEEIGGQHCAVLDQQDGASKIATIVLRGSTPSLLDDVERAVDGGINTYKALCKDARALPGGSATEVEVARRVAEAGRAQTGLAQYAFAQFAAAFDTVPRMLAESSGLNPMDALAALNAAHAAGQVNAGLDLESGLPKDLSVEGITDLYSTKWWAVKLASDAAVSVLKVDQIIMAKQAGGPKPKAGEVDGDD